MTEHGGDRPLTPEEIRALPASPASSAMPAAARVLLDSYVLDAADVRPPDVTTRVTRIENGRGDRVNRYRVELEAQGARLPFTGRWLPAITEIGRVDEHARRPTVNPQGYRPPFHDLRMIPERQRRPELPQEWQFLNDVAQPGPRYGFSDRSFPWCTFGRVTTEDAVYGCKPGPPAFLLALGMCSRTTST